MVTLGILSKSISEVTSTHSGRECRRIGTVTILIEIKFGGNSSFVSDEASVSAASSVRTFAS